LGWIEARDFSMGKALDRVARYMGLPQRFYSNFDAHRPQAFSR